MGHLSSRTALYVSPTIALLLQAFSRGYTYCTILYYTGTFERLPTQALFELHDCNSTAKWLPLSAIVRLRSCSTGGWVHAPRIPACFMSPGPSKQLQLSKRSLIRDGILIERPIRVCRTFYAVSGVTQQLLRYAASLEAAEITGNEEANAINVALTYLINFITRPQDVQFTSEDGADLLNETHVSGLQDLMRELGVLSALITMLTVPFARLGTVAFHRINEERPLLPRCRLVATLLWHSIRHNKSNCEYIYGHITSLEPAARKSVGVGRVLEAVFREVAVDPAQLDFWLDLLSKSRRRGEGDDGWSGHVILSLLQSFCARRGSPVVSNQNTILLKLMVSPKAQILERVGVSATREVSTVLVPLKPSNGSCATSTAMDGREWTLLSAPEVPEGEGFVPRSTLEIYEREKEMLSSLTLPAATEDDSTPIDTRKLRTDVMLDPSLLFRPMLDAAQHGVTLRFEAGVISLQGLQSQPGMLRYYLHELHLLGALCSGFNGLAMKTVSELYPLSLCTHVIMDANVKSELRAAFCVLVRHLYVQTAPARRVRSVAQTVWDWDLLPLGAEVACVSRAGSVPTAREV